MILINLGCCWSCEGIIAGPLTPLSDSVTPTDNLAVQLGVKPIWLMAIFDLLCIRLARPAYQ